MKKHVRVTFHLDGTGLYYDPYEPIHLDALVAFALLPYKHQGDPPARDERPADIMLPLGCKSISGERVWCASALFPDYNDAESVYWWRKRMRDDRYHLTSGSPVLTNGVYRAWNYPLPMTLARTMTGFATALEKPSRLRNLLRRHITSLGKKRSMGRGKVIGLEVEEVEADRSCVNDHGRAMRWLPTPGATRLVRPRPPYWNVIGAVPCCEVGDLAPECAL